MFRANLAFYVQGSLAFHRRRRFTDPSKSSFNASRITASRTAYTHKYTQSREWEHPRRERKSRHFRRSPQMQIHTHNRTSHRIPLEHLYSSHASVRIHIYVWNGIKAVYVYYYVAGVGRAAAMLCSALLQWRYLCVCVCERDVRWRLSMWIWLSDIWWCFYMYMFIYIRYTWILGLLVRNGMTLVLRLLAEWWLEWQWRWQTKWDEDENGLHTVSSLRPHRHRHRRRQDPFLGWVGGFLVRQTMWHVYIKLGASASE